MQNSCLGITVLASAAFNLSSTRSIYTVRAVEATPSGPERLRTRAGQSLADRALNTLLSSLQSTRVTGGTWRSNIKAYFSGILCLGC